MTRVTRATALAATLLLTPAAALASPIFEVGQPFPDLTLPSLHDGRPLRVADFRGQRVILQVFASW